MKGYEIAIGWVITGLLFIFSVWIWCLRKTSEQHSKEVELLVHSKSRYRRDRNNPGFSCLRHCSDLGTAQRARAASACVAEVQMDDMRADLAMMEWSLCGCASRGLSVLNSCQLQHMAREQSSVMRRSPSILQYKKTQKVVPVLRNKEEGSVFWMYSITH